MVYVQLLTYFFTCVGLKLIQREYEKLILGPSPTAKTRLLSNRTQSRVSWLDITPSEHLST